MSAGGVFQIVSNDGKQDKVIMASDLLDARLKQVEDMKRAAAAAQGRPVDGPDTKPDLQDVMKSHLILFKASFKPYVAQAMEYQKIDPTSGGQFDSTLQFSLPQFGDFLTDMVLNLKVSTASASAAPLPAEGVDVALPTAAVAQAQSSLVIDSETSINRIDPDNKVIRSFQYIGFYDVQGRKWNTGDNVADYVRYCDFPGERMLKKVAFTVNGNPLDEYDTYTHVFYRQFKLKEDKRTAYFRDYGQEMPMEAKGAVMTGGVRHGGLVFNGLQTPKAEQPEFDVWQKLMFWFNQDFSVALPSAAIPFGQRFINIELNPASKLLFRSPAVYEFVKVENQYFPAQVFPAAGAGDVFDLSALNFAAPENVWHTTYQIPKLTNGALNYPTLRRSCMYVNNLFVAPAIHDLYIRKIGFSLIRVHRIQENDMGESDKEILMNNFKFPTEYIYLGVIPKENTEGTNQATDWHNFTKNTHKVMPAPIQTNVEGSVMFGNDRHTYKRAVSAIDTIQVKVHGINLYQEISQQFYGSHLPHAFGDNTLVTPKDSGASLINFALFPGIYQPTGYINISRAREFYVKVTSQYTSGTARSMLRAESSALNFLLIADGSAVLRYST